MSSWGLAIGLVLGAVAAFAAEPPPECPETAVRDLLPELVAPMRGEAPIWLVDGFATGYWTAADAPVKTLWVLSRDAGGPLVATGRRLSDGQPLRFRDATADAPGERLVVADPLARSVVPGGATTEVLERYAFVPSYLIYPAPGCWQVTARLGERERRIVIHVRAAGPLEVFLAEESPAPERRAVSVPATGETLYLPPTPVLTAADVAEVEIGEDAFGRPTLELSFTAGGSAKLREVTRANVGKRLAFVSGGEILTAPLIYRPIADGVAVIGGEGLATEIESLAARLRQR